MNKKLYTHQKQIGVPYLESVQNPALFWEMRLGKTTITVSHILKQRSLGKNLIVAPYGALFSWKKELSEYGVPNEEVVQLYGGRESKTTAFLNIGTFYLINKSGFLSLPEISGEKWDNVILDECFLGDTLVDTPTGKKRIDKLKIGDKIYNSYGIDLIVNISKKYLNSFVKIKYLNTEIICSKNHPFLTSSGWVLAENLTYGSELIGTEYVQNQMRILQKNSRKKTITLQVLLKKLFSKMENESKRDISKNTQQKGCSQKSSYEIKEERNEGIFGTRSYYQTQSYSKECKQNAFKSSPQKSFRFIKEYWSSTIMYWREWQSNTKTSTDFTKDNKTGSNNRTCNFFRKMETWLSNKLQSRSSHTRNKISNRSRRPFSQSFSEKETRQEKRQNVKVIRVDSVKIYEQDYTRRYSKCREENIFYDLQIKNHPTFSVNGALVHNSTFIKSTPKTNWSKRYGKRPNITKFYCDNFRNVNRRWILTGTPMPNTPLEIYQQVKFLDSKILPYSNFWAFRTKCFTQINDYDWIIKDNRTLKYLMGLLGKYCSFLTRKDVNLEKRKIYHRRIIPLPAKIQAKYKKAKKDFKLEINNEESIQTAWSTVRWNWMRQMCGGFINSELVTNKKIEELKDLLFTELAGQKVVIWANFLSEITEIYKQVNQEGLTCEKIHGSIPVNEREKIIKKFTTKNSSLDCLIIQPTCGLYGLDLSIADTAIYYSSPFGEAREQSEARIDKIGDPNSKLIIDLQFENTIDEDIYEAIEKKLNMREMFQRILKGK